MKRFRLILNIDNSFRPAARGWAWRGWLLIPAWLAIVREGRLLERLQPGEHIQWQ